MASIINIETVNTMPIETEAIMVTHQKLMFLVTSLTPCQKGVRSRVALVDGACLGFLGIKKVGIVHIVDMLATMTSY